MAPQPPVFRRLRVFAFDPALAAKLDTADINTVVLNIPWEDLAPGPVGEYVAVVDKQMMILEEGTTPPPGLLYPPVELDNPFVLATDGLTPSDGNPQFHQQMVYAVAMWTISIVESALGRQIHWAQDGETYRRQLTLYPHSGRELNAYAQMAEGHFGYYAAPAKGPGPDTVIYTCLSADVIAHTAGHAILWALRPDWIRCKSLDTYALHEGFADTLALLERFSLRDVLRQQLALARGDLTARAQLGIVAQQFGEVLGRESGLRSAFGELVNGAWRPRQPDPQAYHTETEPHARGAILVAAIFDALNKIYRTRTADLFRLATEGSGILPQGDLHPDLVNRLADEAARAARHVCDMCVRALDYCPPLAPTFGDYLRAILTADADLVPGDPWHYRLAFIEAFRRYGIFPEDVGTLSMETLLWPRPPADARWVEVVQSFAQKDLGRDCVPWALPQDRATLYRLLQDKARQLEQALRARRNLRWLEHLDLQRPFAVQAIRPRYRAGPSGELLAQWVIHVVQDDGSPGKEGYTAAGSTLLLDAHTGLLQYGIHKRIGPAAQVDADSSLVRYTERGQPGTVDPLAVLKRFPAASPRERRLRVFAFDPSMGLQLETTSINQVTLHIPWEKLEPGPIGEYLEVIDYDPASGCFYDPADLDNKYLIAQDGYAPSQGVPQFHQQMVYAVAMRTIRNFERSLGRLALWAPAPEPEDTGQDGKPGQGAGDFVPRLRLYPHALRDSNAYYSSARSAVLFGYFQSATTANAAPTTVFSCLSQDIISHEMTHALLDGMHRSFSEASNPDMLAFHEAFADLVALFQHFSLPDVLLNQIANTRGDLASQNKLGELAMEFGSALGNHGALRSAIGAYDEETGQWRALKPDPQAYLQELEPHHRGALLVATVFDAFLTIYRSQIGDLFRIATRGTGVLPAGELPPDLVRRLAEEAAASAQGVLEMCIRALDYCPPVDLTFGDYLRAILTADFDVNPVDAGNRRVAFIEAFRRRGIGPERVRAFSLEGLLWERAPEPPEPVKALLQQVLGERVKAMPAWNLSGNRHHMFELVRKTRDDLGNLLQSAAGASYLGMDNGGRYPIDVRSLHPATRVDWQGKPHLQWIIEIVQDRDGSLTGATVIVDGEDTRVRYLIRKSTVEAGSSRWQGMAGTAAALYANYFDRPAREPFSLLHRS